MSSSSDSADRVAVDLAPDGSGPRPKKLRILLSFGRPHSKSNPFLPLLVEGLSTVAEVHTFSWGYALFGRYDVLHFHWPEHWFQQSSGWRLRVRSVLVRLILLRTDIMRTLIVVTAHNLNAHEVLGAANVRRVERILRRVDLWIVLNPFTPTSDDQPRALIPHGHYRDWYADHAATRSTTDGERTDILFAGFIRPYKGVEILVSEYRKTSIALPLKIMGSPNSSALTTELIRRAEGDTRVTFVFEHVDDEVLAAQIARSALFVLPYRSIHNSGAALLALSFNRPILVPDNEVTRAMREEFGADYVHLFAGDLTGERLTEVVGAIREIDWSLTDIADMSNREWADIGRLHDEAYRDAIEIRSAR